MYIYVSYPVCRKVYYKYSHYLDKYLLLLLVECRYILNEDWRYILQCGSKTNLNSLQLLFAVWTCYKLLAIY